MQIEKRLAAAPFSEVNGRILSGYSVLFGVETKIGDFTEVFERGAFANTLANRRDALRDVVLALNHDQNQVIARQSNSSLTVSEDAKGLKFEAKLADLAIADETIKAVKAGLIGGISVGFISIEEEWPTNNRRIIKQADLIEISVISGHAATLPTRETVSVRSLHKQAESDLMRRLYTFYLAGV